MKKIILAAVSLLLAPLSAQAGISANYSSGGMMVGGDSDTCNGTIPGALRYNSTDKIMEYCNGSSWRQITASASSTPPVTPTSSDGYFVLTAGKWDGNLGGTSGANSKCLSDLTANDWMGKADASARSLLDSTHVKAMIVAGSYQTAAANTRYFFALSGDTSVGGAYFDSNSSGYGPNNTQNWAGSNYFNGYKQYWTGYDDNGVAASWDNYSGNNGALWYCDNGGGKWTDNTSSVNGRGGYTTGSSYNRWSGTAPSCNYTLRLLCFVNP